MGRRTRPQSKLLISLVHYVKLGYTRLWDDKTYMEKFDTWSQVHTWLPSLRVEYLKDEWFET